LVRLSGKNEIDRFRSVAEQLALRVSPLKGVAGVIFIGGLVRGFADRSSDVDVTVFLSEPDEDLRRHIRKIGVDESRNSGLDLDLEIHVLSDFFKRKWDEISMWEFGRAEIVFDPKGAVSRLLRKKLQVSEAFWIRRIAVYAEYLKWYCCPLREEVRTVAETWVDRGDLFSAHYCLNYSVDLVIRLLFALNREFLPAPKWRVFYSYGLKLLPKNYKMLLQEAIIVRSVSVADLKRRMKAIRLLWHEIVHSIEKDAGLSLEQLSKFYVKDVLRQA